MSVLQEYMAGMLGFGVGKYYQFSNNLHAYIDVLKKLDSMQPEHEPYLTLGEDGLQYNPPALIDEPSTFDIELIEWFEDVNRLEYENTYLGDTCAQMRLSWLSWKAKNYTSAYYHAQSIGDRAWSKACVEWLDRRLN
jgi:hypothetical protein